MNDKNSGRNKSAAQIAGRIAINIGLFLIFYIIFAILLSIILNIFFSFISAESELIALFAYFISLFLPAIASIWFIQLLWKHTNRNDTQFTVETVDGKAVRQTRSVGSYILAIIVVLGGLFAGFVVGGIINFGACWKSECSVIEETAPLTIPLASLLFTVPLSRSILRKSSPSSTQQDDISSPNYPGKVD